MKASELIVKLKELKEAYGDLPIKRWEGDSYYEPVLDEVQGVCINVDDDDEDYIQIY